MQDGKRVHGRVELHNVETDAWKASELEASKCSMRRGEGERKKANYNTEA
jgi:hypothetical protein